MNRLLIGSLAGLLATVPMSAVMSTLFKQLPFNEQYPLPPREITEKVTDDIGVSHKLEEHEHTLLALVAHFAYGAATGAIYNFLVRKLPLPGTVKGMGYGLSVWTVSYLGLLPALGILRPATEHPARRNALMIAAHIVWGLSLEGSAARLNDKLA